MPHAGTGQFGNFSKDLKVKSTMLEMPTSYGAFELHPLHVVFAVPGTL